MVPRRVVLLGSVNMDFTINVPRLPRLGESVIGLGDMIIGGGGKGANAAVAMARLGVPVDFIGAIGDDEYGAGITEIFRHEGVGIDNLYRLENTKTGIAQVVVDPSGEVQSAVAPGANAKVTPEMVAKIVGRLGQDVIAVTQFEVPIDAVLRFLEAARAKGALVLLDPAPPVDVPRDIISLADFITPNEVEAEWFWGRNLRVDQDAEDCARDLAAIVKKAAILTRGPMGAVYCEKDSQPVVIPGLKVKAVDSTGAGDAFVGGFCYGLIRGKPPLEAARFANMAAALSTTRRCAMASLPNCDEVVDFQTACIGLELR